MASPDAVATAARYGAYCTREVEAIATDLDQYAALLLKWQRTHNLVSRETMAALWTRHIADSLQVQKRLRPEDRRFLDLGSGGGFPAIPLAIARSGSGASFTLVEANQKKASFLRAAGRELGLDIEVRAERIGEIDSRETIRPDVITSRALASLTVLCRHMVTFFGPNTRAILHKGREYGEELEEARAAWHFDVVVVPSDTSVDGVLLELRDLRANTAS
ncbi:MAG: 16S rRNA (guanine(527)-N(7))-methyltransferase RsmG [Devosia sp.]|nr:16S rRNA (guanine(527)-N(7))-methyltransferase RsmG [Devosia sp.]